MYAPKRYIIALDSAKLISLIPRAIVARNMLIESIASQMVTMVKIGKISGDLLVTIKRMAMMGSIVLDVDVEVGRLITNMKSK